MKPILILILCLCSAVCNAGQRSHPDSWKNFYALAWSGSGTESSRYAKQMGYDCISTVISRIPNHYKNNNVYAGLKFYIADPNTTVIQHRFGYSSTININGTYTQTQIDWYNQNMAWKSNDAFPNNLVPTWWSGGGTIFTVQWDFQQQRVIDLVVDNILAMNKSYESTNLPFTFAGYMYDGPGGITGSCNLWDGSENDRVLISYWTGTNSAILHDDITHEYSTQKEGKAAFYKQLQESTKREFSNAKWIVFPWVLYNSLSNAYGVYDEWVYQIKDRSDRDELTPDMLIQEGMNAGDETLFVDNINNFNSGVNISKDRVGSHNNKKVSEYKNRLIAGKAGVNGAWNCWFGSFGDSGTDGDGVSMPSFSYKIEQVYPRLKLSRIIPTWDNLNDVPVSNRATVTASYGTETYRATHTTASSGTIGWSYIGQYGMYSRHWKRPTELFVVKMGTDTHLYDPVVIGSGEYIKDIYSTNEYFEPVADVKSTQWTKTGNSWQLNEGVIGTSTDGGIGYIFIVLPIGGYTN